VENKKTKRLIVIKRFNKEGVALAEAKALSQCSHNNLVKILGAGSGKQKTVIVMEYAPGGSLADRLVRTYNWEEAFAIGVQIVHGLAAAHKQHIVHGNLRPSNVLFDGDDTVKLSDFGSPQHYSARRNWYSPPEKGVSARGDIYSLGVILHQMLYGQTPNFSRHGQLLIPEHDIRIPDPVRHMLQRSLALKNTERYQSCDELLSDWEEFTRAREASAAPVKAEPATPKSRRQPSGMFMLTVGLLIGMALGIVISYLVGLPV
ncbi:MAG TPA: protein kinase, partial [candidate division Zixibacteria bacterium]|nr:protein kinase [candidate division Zixibacteria bacterium]